MRQLCLAVLALSPTAARACSVCFGAAEGQKGFFDGLWWGIVVLLAVTMSLVGGIGWAVWSVERRRLEKDA